ncbi:MAG: HNH endonuclease family protein, partial [Alphaproteobacteria bacterium]
FRAIESYVIRRMATKLQTRGYGPVFVEVLKAARDAGGHPGHAAIEALRAHSQVWPDQNSVLESFRDSRYYGPGGINQERLRLILGEIDKLMQKRSTKTEPAVFDYARLQIEHVIPQDWRQKWPVDEPDAATREVGEIERDRHINRIGNLTLVKGNLNASISNHPWATKRAGLAEHSKLALNAQIIENDYWDETRITIRGASLAREFDEIWPGPESTIWDKSKS